VAGEAIDQITDEIGGNKRQYQTRSQNTPEKKKIMRNDWRLEELIDWCEERSVL